MKRARLIPSILVLILSVAVLTVGVYALQPQSGTISGQISIDPALTPVEITGYIDDKQVYTYNTNNTSTTWNLTSNNGFKFNMIHAISIDEVPDIQIRLHIKNLSGTPLGAYFYSNSGNLSDNLTDATCVEVESTIKNSSSKVIADVYMSSYTYIAPIDGVANGYDEADLYVLISARELLRQQSSGTFNLNLKIEKYSQSSTGTLVKLPTNESTLSSVPNSSDAQIVVIPTSYTTINSSAFTNVTKLTSIILPKSISSVSVGILANCNAIKQITSATQIISAYANNSTAFSSKTSLKAYIYTGSSLTTQFNNITSNLKVILSNSVTTVSNAFDSATAIKKIYIPSSVSINQQWISSSASIKAVKIAVSGTSITASDVFYYAGGTNKCTTIHIVGNSLTISAGSNRTFTPLKNLILDGTITSISLPSTCAFQTIIYTSQTTPTTISLSYGLSSTGYIYVPSSSLDNYISKYSGKVSSSKILGR